MHHIQVCSTRTQTDGPRIDHAMLAERNLRHNLSCSALLDAPHLVSFHLPVFLPLNLNSSIVEDFNSEAFQRFSSGWNGLTR
ncbi:hypothetical protein DPMN_076559 [Dreissena polymorpha]|uniref:Uncharacterized protein n=1 Tax=Dreissena polymorpha TaxID=45954 RepID=A0A9D3YKB8_DREPO|nr:hypothetical protein DPMN_076559 [Dreissena polymorpha]